MFDQQVCENYHDNKESLNQDYDDVFDEAEGRLFSCLRRSVIQVWSSILVGVFSYKSCGGKSDASRTPCIGNAGGGGGPEVLRDPCAVAGWLRSVAVTTVFRLK